MTDLLQNREQNIEHVGIYIAEHRKQFPCIAGALEHPIAGVQHRSVWLGLKLGPIVTKRTAFFSRIRKDATENIYNTQI